MSDISDVITLVVNICPFRGGSEGCYPQGSVIFSKIETWVTLRSCLHLLEEKLVMDQQTRRVEIRPPQWHGTNEATHGRYLEVELDLWPSRCWSLAKIQWEKISRPQHLMKCTMPKMDSPSLPIWDETDLRSGIEHGGRYAQVLHQPHEGWHADEDILVDLRLDFEQEKTPFKRHWGARNLEYHYWHSHEPII
jgi:hypothetical protein